MGCPETVTQAPDWILSSVHDRGPGTYYRYRVTGINLNCEIDGYGYRFSWEIPESPTNGPSAHRYDVTLATWKIDNGAGIDAVPESIRPDIIRAIARLDVLSDSARVYGSRAFDDRYAIDLVKAGLYAADTVYTFRSYAPRNGVDPDRAIREARATEMYRQIRGGVL